MLTRVGDLHPFEKFHGLTNLFHRAIFNFLQGPIFTANKIFVLSPYRPEPKRF